MRRTVAALAAGLFALALTTVPVPVASAAVGQITGLGGKCVDISGANTANGTAVQLWDCNGTGAQQWNVGTDGTIRALGKCMDVTSAGTADGTRIQLWDCNGTGAQVWTVRATNEIVNPQSNKCLDATGSSTANGTRLQIFTCNGGANQRWVAPGGGGGTPPPPPDAFWGDTSTIPAARNVVMVKVLNRTNGRYPDSQVFWNFNGQIHSIAEQPFLDMPANSAGRMYFYLGSPTSQYFDFIEFTVGAAVFNGNTTRVDAFGVKLAMRLHARDGFDVSVGEDQATFAEDRSVTFQKFMNEVPAQFDVLAQSQAPFRIIAPGSDPTFRTGGVNANYFTAYANSVGVNAPTSDVFGCAGTLSNNPGMCAALNRHVATRPQADWSNPANYYLAAPANYYAKFWHDHAINKLAYGFPYDDFAGQSSFISHGNPQFLLVAVGW
jgi:hypothetical protein